MLFLFIFINVSTKMSRPKQEITKETKIQFRIEKELKEKYISICKKNKIIFSKRIRDFIENDLKKMENG